MQGFSTPTFTSSERASFKAQPLTDERIRTLAPSVFAAEPHSSRSARYAYIPTAEVLQGLRAQGFEVFSAAQARCRDASRVEHTKHLLRLRHLGQEGRALDVGDAVAEICLLNSHDGTSAYQMLAGMFRVICRNGLMVSDRTVASVKVPHSGKVTDRVVSGAFEILDGCTRVVEDCQRMRAINLTADEQGVFARAALQVRYDEGAAPIAADVLLRPRRLEDRAGDLWTVFNKVQENAVRGGLAGRTAAHKPTTTREVRGIDQSVKLNRALWQLADEMARLKEAH